MKMIKGKIGCILNPNIFTVFTDEFSEVQVICFPRHLGPPVFRDFPSTAVWLKYLGVVQSRAQLLEGEKHDERFVSSSPARNRLIWSKSPRRNGSGCSRLQNSQM